MELRTLHYFLAVARKGSITAAADWLHVTQPNLSRQLSELEEELGKQLFIRGKRKITLTPEGVLFKMRAEEIESLVHQLKDEITETRELVSGMLCLGTAERPAMYTVMEAVGALKKEQPLIRFHLCGGTQEERMQRLETDELEFAVVTEPADVSHYDYRRLPEQVCWGLLMRGDHPLAALSGVAPDALRDSPAAIPAQPLFKNQIAGWLGRHDRKVNVVADYSRISDAVALAASGICVSLVMEGAVSQPEAEGLCFRPLVPELCSDVLLIWKKYYEFTPAGDYFYRQLERGLSRL